MEMSFTTPVHNFVSDKTCLIVEPSAPFAQNIQSCLESMGFSRNKIMICRRAEDAKNYIKKYEPQILITEFELHESMGLHLVEEQEQIYSEDRKISIVVTSNASDSAIAEAAEGSVDAYILKPFSPDLFQQKVKSVVEKKIHPSTYMQYLQVGRTLAKEGRLDMALHSYQKAKVYEEKPSLACSFAGEVFHKKGGLENALNEFKSGRSWYPLHYRCLMGEFEVLMAQKKYQEAYKIVPLISANYPLTSQRLGLIFISAVYTYNFNDLPNYYALFLQIEHRSERLIELTSMALFVAGKYFLRQKDYEMALNYFDMSLTTRRRDIKFTEVIVNELLKFKAAGEASMILSKALPSDFGSPLHSQLKFKIDRYLMPVDRVIEAGRKLIVNQEATPEISMMIIELLAQTGKETLAESLIEKIAEAHPKLRDTLYSILSKNLKPSA